jgi:hypothetical protein
LKFNSKGGYIISNIKIFLIWIVVGLVVFALLDDNGRIDGWTEAIGLIIYVFWLASFIIKKDEIRIMSFMFFGFSIMALAIGFILYMVVGYISLIMN